MKNSLNLSEIGGGLLLAALFAGPAFANPTTGECVKDVIAQVAAAKQIASACLDQLELDIQEAIDLGTPLDPAVIEARTQQCEDVEFTSAERKAALLACT